MTIDSQTPVRADELLPCPRCESAAELRVDRRTGKWSVECSSARCVLGQGPAVYGETGALATAAWNRRATPEPTLKEWTVEEHAAINATLSDLGGYQAVFNAMSEAVTGYGPKHVGLSPMKFAHLLGPALERLALQPAGPGVGLRPDAAFDLGFAWRGMLTGQTLEDGRAVGRTLGSDLFTSAGLNLADVHIPAFVDADLAICQAKAAIKKALATPGDAQASGTAKTAAQWVDGQIVSAHPQAKPEADDAPNPWVDTRIVRFDDTIVFGHGGFDFERWESFREEMHTPEGSWAVWKSGRLSWSMYGGPNGLLALDRYGCLANAKADAEEAARSISEWHRASAAPPMGREELIERIREAASDMRDLANRDQFAECLREDHDAYGAATVLDEAADAILSRITGERGAGEAINASPDKPD